MARYAHPHCGRGRWAPKPNAGPHKLRECLPLIVGEPGGLAVHNSNHNQQQQQQQQQQEQQQDLKNFEDKINEHLVYK